MTPSQIRSAVQKAQRDAQRAVDNYNRAARQYNSAVTKFVNDYNREIRNYNAKARAACLEGKGRHAAWVAEHGAQETRGDDDRDAASERGMKDRRDRGGRRDRGERRPPREDRGAASAGVEVVRKGEVVAAPAPEAAKE